MYALDLLCFSELFRFDLALMKSLVRDPGGVVIVAESEDGMAGFVIANLTRRGKRLAAYVTTLDVHPGLRRSGLGRRLMAEAERRCFEARARWMSLHVSTANLGAMGFYEARGYVRGGRVAGYYGSGGDAWIYGKGLGDVGSG